jgi:transcriptional regulator with XRE-family HTH domain
MTAINKNSLLKQVGQNLKKIRKEKKLEIKDVVTQLRITPQAYGNIENGKVDLNISRLADIANVLQVGVEEILNTEGGDVTNYHSTNNSGDYQVQHVEGYHINHIGVVNIPEENFLNILQKEMEQLRQQIATLAAALSSKK